MSLAGWATPEGTDRFRKRFGAIPPDHFRPAQGLWMSSIGVGTYLGDYDDVTDQAYREAVVRAIESGSNVIDSAINYRLQRSERSIGAALKDLAKRGFARDEIVIATKGGFMSFDATPPKEPRKYVEEQFLKSGLAKPSDIVGGCHCMAPRYLLNQLEGSLRNLNVESIDIYYVHNPETQLGAIRREEFEERLSRAFEALEGAVAAGKIRIYGAATWNAFRNDPDAQDYLSLAEVVATAERVAGASHHFKVIQLPLNLAMSEALSKANQKLGNEFMTALQAAQALGLTVMCSASVLQGQLARNLPAMIRDTFEGLETDAQRALQFVRSTPGVTTALVGMKRLDHVHENMKTARTAPAPWEQYSKLFEST